MLFGDHGKLLAACDSNGAVRLWTVTGRPHGYTIALHPQQPTEHRGTAWACAFRPGDSQLLTVGNDGGAQIWDAATGQGKRILRGHGRRISGVAFSADGTQLATAGNDGVVRLWETRTGRRTEELTGRGDRLVSAAFSPVEAILATASNDGDVYLWDPVGGEYLRELDAETEHVWAEAFNADGTLLATANDDDSVRVWFRPTGSPVSTLTEHRGRVRSIAFRPDADVLATGCDDSFVRVWDARSGGLLEQLGGHGDRVYGVAYGPGSAWLASASWDGTAIVWRDGQADRRLRGRGGRLWTVAAHPSRPLLATGGDDRAVGLWDAATGDHLSDLVGHTGRVLSLAFSPDGTTLASGAEDGTVRLWNVPADGEPPSLRATLMGMTGGWAALTPAGGYKYEGDVAGEFWHVVGMSRFTPGSSTSTCRASTGYRSARNSDALTASATVGPHDAHRSRGHRGAGPGPVTRPAPRSGGPSRAVRRPGLGQPAVAARRGPRRPAALGDAVRGRAAAQGARLAARPRPGPAPARSRPAAHRRALREVPAPLDRHHLGPRRARRPRPGHARRRRGRRAGRLPDGSSPARPRRGTRRQLRPRGPLAATADGFAEGLASATELGLIPDPEAVRAVWEDAVAAPVWAGPALWLHSDLHPANVLTADGSFCGVIDFGDLCAGDPACDLAAPWILLPDGAVDRFHAAYRPAADEATLRRARGWAVQRALGGILIGEAGVRGRPGGKPTWGPPAQAALRRLVATAD